MQRTGEALPCQAPSRPSHIPGHPSLNHRYNTSTAWVISGPGRQISWKASQPVSKRIRPEPRWPGHIIAVSY